MINLTVIDPQSVDDNLPSLSRQKSNISFNNNQNSALMFQVRHLFKVEEVGQKAVVVKPQV